jgi:hypothetical protein
MKKFLLIFSLVILTIISIALPLTLEAQTYLHTSGIYIKDGNNNDFILRGIGTGNWLIQEGYMMQSSDVAGTQHEFEAKLEGLIGPELKDSFYTVWLDSHFRRIDVDSMKSWGFNSVRVAMHYKWFTPPIEKEPVPGQITWFEDGFTRIDSLLDWCADNEMYLILDLHGAPGGQGENGSISDYDPSKPSLWQSQANKDKTVALWKKLAERYSTEPWIGGYDLINETNWTFSPANNSQMLSLFKRITDSIRVVDKNHIIFIEGNSFANDFSGLTPAWDANMAYSFHKYWDNPTQDSFTWIINLRNSTQRPIWLGESGENSNSWFTSAIALCEKNKIGWSWWPVKKPGINNPLSVTVNKEYTQLINYWKGTVTTPPTTEAALNAVLQFALNHKLENCTYNKGVIDAMFRQTKSIETIPYKLYHTGEPVFMSDYNLGRNKYAYFDTDTANTGGTATVWNQGWSYRNDGVDIEACTDAQGNNGYSVGWTASGEWMEYTVEVDSTAGYTLAIRSASNSGSSRIHMEVNGKAVSPSITLAATGGWQAWKTTSVSNVMLSKGIQKVRMVFDQGGSNVNFFKLSDPITVANIGFTYLVAESSTDGTKITLNLNRDMTSATGDISLSDFVVTCNAVPVEITGISAGTNASTIVLTLAESLYYGGAIKLSYQGSSILNGVQVLEPFTDMVVTNKLPYRFTIPALIQAEDFSVNGGLSSEKCTDTGGGTDMGYAAPGEFLDFYVYVPLSKWYTINIRAATTNGNSEVIFRKVEGKTVTAIDTIKIPATGGWQNWKTYTAEAFMAAGRYTIRMYVRSGEFNTNWIQFLSASGVKVNEEKADNFSIYPNPASDFIELDLSVKSLAGADISIFNAIGKVVKTVGSGGESKIRINTSDLEKGMYFVVVKSGDGMKSTSKLVIL